MSNNDNKPKSNVPSLNSYEAAIDPKEVVKSSSGLDVVLWLLAVTLLIGSTLVNRYLPTYFAEGQSVWVRAVVIIVMLGASIGLMYATQQGKGFLVLLKDARREISLITWATKEDTLKTTWIVLLVVVVVSIVLSLFDLLSNTIMKAIVG